MGKEILEQCPDVDSLTHVFVPVGGGGLIAGIAAYIKAVRPSVKIIGVEPTGTEPRGQSRSQLAERFRSQLAKRFRSHLAKTSRQINYGAGWVYASGANM